MDLTVSIYDGSPFGSKLMSSNTMFPSFTGSARPRRQVNLSGRNNNPFAALPGSRLSSSPQTTQNALAHAQQERILRQQERERPPAATRIQRTWRGHQGRKEAMHRWRQDWDSRERWGQHGVHDGPYSSDAECLSQLRLLGQFASPRSQDDIGRLHHFTSRYLASLRQLQTAWHAGIWSYPQLRLAKIILATLRSNTNPPLPPHIINDFLTLLRGLATAVALQLALHSHEYYHTLAELSTSPYCDKPVLIEAAALALLEPNNANTTAAYEGFTSELLTIPDLPSLFGGLESVAAGVDYASLADALNGLLESSSQNGLLHSKSKNELLWLLSYFIYFRRWACVGKHKTTDFPDGQYVKIVSRLISFLADDIGTRIDASNSSSLAASDGALSTRRPVEPLPEFVRSEISTLVNQENVSGLLANLDVGAVSKYGASETSNMASALASYALTLLKAFPKRGDEIRMWLYRGSTSRPSSQHLQGGKSVPAIKYFYQAASKTQVYQSIRDDPKETVNFLRPDRLQSQTPKATHSRGSDSRDQQWRVILLFLELYTFILKVMDDEEFLSGSSPLNSQSSWTRQSALPLGQVEDVTIFLKNLAFSMYWNASEIAGIEANDTKTSLAAYFGRSSSTQVEIGHDSPPTKLEEMAVAGVRGMTLAYMKGMVTGVLRMLYERE